MSGVTRPRRKTSNGWQLCVGPLRQSRCGRLRAHLPNTLDRRSCATFITHVRSTPSASRTPAAAAKYVAQLALRLSTHAADGAAMPS